MWRLADDVRDVERRDDSDRPWTGARDDEMIRVVLAHQARRACDRVIGP
jgi:hypothetical protein